MRKGLFILSISRDSAILREIQIYWGAVITHINLAISCRECFAERNDLNKAHACSPIHQHK